MCQGGKTILIAEDNELNMGLLNYSFQVHCYGAVKTRDSWEAAGLISEYKLGLILMDINLLKICWTTISCQKNLAEAQGHIPATAVPAILMNGD